MINMLKIGDFSRLSNTSIRMLRHYDEINLLKPVKIDSNSGYRFYNANQLDVINQISRYKELGISLAGIKEILESKDDANFIKKYLSVRMAELNEESQKIKKQMALLESANNLLVKGTEYMKYSVVVKTIPKKEVISLRKIIHSREEEGMLWIELDKEINKQKISLSKECHSLAFYHDDEYKDSDIDVEIQTAINGSGKDCGNIKFFTALEQKVVSVTFRGSYVQRPQVARAIAEWLEASDYTIDGPMISIFHVTPYETPEPDSWVTEVCYTVKRKK
jgi:DNA-binding transcriptional MerR regulator